MWRRGGKGALVMGRAQFEYDEVGNTFYYVLVSFYALILIPATFFFWPSSKLGWYFIKNFFLFGCKINFDYKTERKEYCYCGGCIEKRIKAEAKRPWRRTKKFLTFLALALAWIIFFIIVRKVTQIEVEHTEYDPYAILGIDQVIFFCILFQILDFLCFKIYDFSFIEFLLAIY
ncbi:unnamed protein product [Onchocerca flexuosa]|uniref:7TM_GPCR_Srx domain-containing protein n=1 Tax=Onchocerca flexuosa TaxID=387005 RepID=A0A183I2J9_9BILA|nr:unnamed protein product [Onchocerca flexuosa]